MGHGVFLRGVSPDGPSARRRGVSLIVLLVLASGWTACRGPAPTARLDTELPPDIPSPPVIATAQDRGNPQAETLRKREVEKDRYLAFRQAFLFARTHRAMAADTPPDAPYWQAPVTRAELAFWLAHFAGLVPDEDAQGTFLDVPDDRPDAVAIERVVRRGWFQTEAVQGERAFRPETPVTREALCELLARIKEVDRTLASARSVVMAQSHPPSAQPTGENFEHFRDREAITPDRRAAVAWAYEQNLLETVFLLSPTDLTAREGFAPQTPVTRQQAMIALARAVLPPEPPSPAAAPAPPPLAPAAGQP